MIPTAFLKRILSLAIFLLFLNLPFHAQTKKDTSIWSSSTFAGLKLRNIGPAYMSGRIADIAIHPENANIWYVAVGSGGVWKTENAGTTWTPLFDQQAVYSIGCLTIDPTNPHTIWVGTGENVGGRHVGFGDGIYKSDDDGKTWKNMGLRGSNHLSKIIVHPKDPNTLWVAAQGPLWHNGGLRGLFKTSDGGQTWKNTLQVDEWTGVTDIVIDPRTPKRLYAAAWQRHRNVAAYMGGGPGTGIYRSEDGGDTWEKLNNGLPQTTMGKIGLSISPQKPDVLYAAIELERRTGGVYKSTNRGAHWEKQSDAVAGATGPHYYQELYACPHRFDRLYLVDVRMQVSEDGGKTFKHMKEEKKHSDNHALAFRKEDPNYLLVGTDGGLYESFDRTQSWRYIANLPITQYYKVAVDDAEPFYSIYGGTQDNSTQGGPSRTDKAFGISNAEWFLTLGGDGHQPATEPGNPNIMYSESQEGFLFRVDRSTGEVVLIQPQPAAGEGFERYNWDAPILVSPHSPTRLYFASHRVWRSDNRGDSWTAISGDLTKNQERMELPIMDQTWSWDAQWDFLAMSTYNTITSLAESPQQEGLLYAGTDDGHIQITKNGEEWRKINVDKLPGVPPTAFINDIKADLFDANTVYVALDNHKFGDLKPYLYKSTDKGKSWTSISSNIPDSTLIWRVVQDHQQPGLFFAATEFGIYFTVNSGERWTKLTGNVPTISFRDLAIQRRENDLVGASFGRSFFVLDDYSPLRWVTEEQLQQEATLFPTRKSWWYIPRRNDQGSQGAAHYVAPNPPFGAVFTYYLKDGYSTLKKDRQKNEQQKIKDKETVTFGGWNAVEKEMNQQEPQLIITIKDQDDQIIRRLNGPVDKGFHRINWDLRYPSRSPIDTNKPWPKEEERQPTGILALPGTYTATLSKLIDGRTTVLSEPISFEVVPLRSGALKAASQDETLEFWKKTEQLLAEVSLLSASVKQSLTKVEVMQKALNRSQDEPGQIETDLHDLRNKLLILQKQLTGHPGKNAIGEKTAPTVYSRIILVAMNNSANTYGPTPLLKDNLEIGERELKQLQEEEKKLSEKIKTMVESWKKKNVYIIN
jgi:photosystem II stability/assembly factor-like uncharacterized protein